MLQQVALLEDVGPVVGCGVSRAASDVALDVVDPQSQLVELRTAGCRGHSPREALPARTRNRTRPSPQPIRHSSRRCSHSASRPGIERARSGRSTGSPPCPGPPVQVGPAGLRTAHRCHSVELYRIAERHQTDGILIRQTAHRNPEPFPFVSGSPAGWGTIGVLLARSSNQLTQRFDVVPVNVGLVERRRQAETPLGIRGVVHQLRARQTCIANLPATIP